MAPILQTGAWLDSPKPNATLKIRKDLPIASPGPKEVLVKLICTGVWYVLLMFTEWQTISHTCIVTLMSIAYTEKLPWRLT
jgi:hypothetical protein